MSHTKRNPYFDNAKFLLMILVVFGHILQPFIDASPRVHDLYFVIFSFHMPAFIFISGYFSKSLNLQKSFQKTIVPYIIFQWIYSLFYWLVGSSDHFSFQLHIPNWSLWFLVSSFFWQVSLYFFQKVPAKIGIPVSILLSLLVGYLPFIGRELTLQRTIVFLPFFVAGYYLKPATVEKFLHWDKKRFLAVGFLLIYGVIYAVEQFSKYVFFGSKPYDDFLNFPEWGALVRIVALILGVIGIIAFMGCVPQKVTNYTARGKYTLVIYLLHGFVVQGLRGVNFEQVPFNILMFGLLLLGSIALTYLLSTEKIGQTYAKFEKRLLGKPHI